MSNPWANYCCQRNESVSQPSITNPAVDWGGGGQALFLLVGSHKSKAIRAHVSIPTPSLHCRLLGLLAALTHGFLMIKWRFLTDLPLFFFFL